MNNLICPGLMPMTKKRKGSVYTANAAPGQEYWLEGNFFFFMIGLIFSIKTYIFFPPKHGKKQSSSLENSKHGLEEASCALYQHQGFN